MWVKVCYLYQSSIHIAPCYISRASACCPPVQQVPACCRNHERERERERERLHHAEKFAGTPNLDGVGQLWHFTKGKASVPSGTLENFCLPGHAIMSQEALAMAGFHGAAQPAPSGPAMD